MYITLVGIKVRGAAMGLLYKKILRLRSLKDKKIGEVGSLIDTLKTGYKEL